MQILQKLQTKHIKPNLPNHLKTQAYQAKPTKPNLPNQTEPNQTKPNLRNQIKLSQPSLLNPTYQTKLQVKVVNAWVRSAFGNV